jgi:hypothetical protein
LLEYRVFSSQSGLVYPVRDVSLARPGSSFEMTRAGDAISNGVNLLMNGGAEKEHGS